MVLKCHPNGIQSTLCNSYSLGHRENSRIITVRITKIQIIKVFLGIFKGPGNFVRIGKHSSCTSSNETELSFFIRRQVLISMSIYEMSVFEKSHSITGAGRNSRRCTREMARTFSA